MSLPAGYVGLLPILTTTAREHGYALGLHGSLGRDMDLIAAPWVDTASEPKALIKALAESIHIYEVFNIVGPEIKPVGRLAWAICIGSGAVIDVSVMPMLRKKK